MATEEQDKGFGVAAQGDIGPGVAGDFLLCRITADDDVELIRHWFGDEQAIAHRAGKSPSASSTRISECIETKSCTQEDWDEINELIRESGLACAGYANGDVYANPDTEGSPDPGGEILYDPYTGSIVYEPDLYEPSAPEETPDTSPTRDSFLQGFQSSQELYFGR